MAQVVPPPRICRELAAFDPNLRLCWVNHWTDEDGGRFGCFGVVHLKPRWLAGFPEHPFILEPLWENVIGKGPLYAKDGTPGKKDWSATLQPVLVFSVTPKRGFTTRDLFNGRFLKVLRQNWVSYKEFKRRAVARDKAADARMEDRHQNLVGEMADYWNWLGNRTYDTGLSTWTKEDVKANTPDSFWRAHDGEKAWEGYHEVVNGGVHL